MNGFSLHSTLREDCHILGAWHEIWVLLHRDAAVFWFILVPETDRTEWHELPGETRQKLALISRTLSSYLKTGQHCDKINLGIIGNLVPQLHMHVIGRWKTDPYWPGVVWGKSQPEREYTPEQVNTLRDIVDCLLKQENL